MILYHGTSEHAARQALIHGLRPRRLTGETNWTHTVESNPDAVYLTDTYACHYAMNARLHAPRLPDDNGKLTNRVAVIEIDTRGLLFSNLRADEDYLVHMDPSPADVKAKLLYYRKLESHRWKQSLAALGTCAHVGAIKPQNIRRVAFFDHKSNRDMALAMSDAVISLPGFRFCGHLHRKYQAWLFGEEISPEDIGISDGDDELQHRKYEYWAGVLANRDGIEIVTRSAAGRSVEEARAI